MNREVCEHFNPVDLPCAKCAEKRKSEAMFLADELEAPLGTIIGAELHRRAAAELRRQHGEIESMRAERMRTERRLLGVHAQRDALLEAYRKMKNVAAGYSNLCDGSAFTRKLEREFEAVDAIARALIKAEREACAKLCEAYDDDRGTGETWGPRFAALIRERGNT